MSLSQTLEDSKSNHRAHDVLRLEIQSLRASLDSLAAYSEAIANLRSLHEVAEQLHLLLSDILAHFVHEEQTVLKALERLGPEEARFAETMREQHQMLSNGLAQLFRKLSEIHDSNDLRASLRELQDVGAQFSNLLLHHFDAEDRKMRLLVDTDESAVVPS